MNGITADDVGSKPKASKATVPQSQVRKPPNRVIVALRQAAVSPRRWVATTCVVLAISGGQRYWRDAEFSGLAQAAKQSPFPLAELPKTLGSWKTIDGLDGQLDPEIARVAGASDHIVRTYMNDETGESVFVLVVYGLAHSVGHTPEICYPAAGFRAYESMSDYPLKLPGLEKTAHYRGGFFTKKTARIEEYTEVVYSFRFTDEWITDIVPRWKMSRIHPGVFKIQIARQVNEPSVAAAVETSPSIPLLGDLVEEIEKRLTQVPGKSGKSAAADQGKPSKT